MKKIIISLITCLLILTSCVFAPSLSNMEVQSYASRAGYHITLPASWLKAEEDAQSVIFTAPDNAVSLTMISELGGEAYYSLEEIADMLLAKLPNSGPWQISRTIVDTEKELRLFAKSEAGTRAEVKTDTEAGSAAEAEAEAEEENTAVETEVETGTEIETEADIEAEIETKTEIRGEAVLDITIFQPYPGIRYYLLFAASSAAYNQQRTLIGDIVKSFVLDQDLPYLYGLMEEWREVE